MPNPFDAVSCFFLKPVSGFFGCFANPRTAFGFKRKGVFNPHLSGVIISAAPIGAIFYHPRRPSRKICGFGLANTGAPMCRGASNRVRRTLEPALQVLGRRKSRQGWPI